METKVISFRQNESLSVLQLATSFQNSFSYISSGEAIRKNLIEVKEVNESGNVNLLLVFNSSPNFVFFMDGDILAGAKQNRVLNTSVLLAPNSKTVLPVSCVEQGRWRHQSDKFSETDYSAPSKMRAEKAQRVSEGLKMNLGFTSNQGEVWDSVREFCEMHSVKSQTSSLSDVYNNKMDDFDKFTSSFELNEGANGLAVFINSRLLHIDIFNRMEIYGEYFPKLLRGDAMESFNLKKEKDVTEAEAAYKALSFLDSFETLQFEEHPGVGVGIEKRFESKSLIGSELSYNDNIIHLTALNIHNNKGQSNASRIRRTI